jgi:hypothetical protein
VLSHPSVKDFEENTTSKKFKIGYLLEEGQEGDQNIKMERRRTQL